MKKLLLILFVTILSTVQSEAQVSKTTVAPGSTVQVNILRFYPNPATTVINFDFQKSYDKGYSIQVFNFLGRKMLEQSNLADRVQINLTDYTRGVYVYQLRDKTGRLVESGKFQVSK